MIPVLSIREIINTKGYALSTYCQMPGAFSAEVYASQGWDAVTLDLQHGMIGFTEALAMLQAMRGTGVTPLARVPALDPALIMQLLDAGMMGIICAMINTRAQAERLVQICRYPPLGERSFGPARAALVHGRDYGERANVDIAVYAMVETAESVSNIDEILDVPGLDGIYIGPGDLALSMGFPADPGARPPEVDEAIATVRDRSVARGLTVGMLAHNASGAWNLVRNGCGFVTLSSDLHALKAQAGAWVSGFRSLAGEADAPREN